VKKNVLEMRLVAAPVFAAALVCSAWLGDARAELPVIRPARVIQCGGSDARPAVVTGISISADGRTIAAAADDHRVTLWDAQSAEFKRSFDDHADWVRSVVVSPDGATVASGAGDHLLCMWEIDGQARQFQLRACDNAIAGVSFHPNNQQLAIVGFSNSLQIVNTSTGQISQELVCPCADVRTVTFSGDGERMAVAGRSGKIRVWNLTSGARERDIETDGRRIRALSFSPDGRRLAAAGSSPVIRILDAESGHTVATLNTRPAQVHALVFVDERRLATGGTDNRILLWDLDSRQATAQLVGHTGTVAALACDARGSTLVSGSYDTTMRIWNLDERRPAATASREPAASAR
jgi:WD40 repeat protein